MIRNQESWKVSERKKERKLRIDPTPERGRGKGGALGGGGIQGTICNFLLLK
jgi:hypothetical protein